MIHLSAIPSYVHIASILSLMLVGCGRVRKVIKAAADLAVFVFKAGGPAFDLAGISNTVGAPSFAFFAKGGNRRRLR